MPRTSSDMFVYKKDPVWVSLPTLVTEINRKFELQSPGKWTIASSQLTTGKP
jgi:hypothetical protein